MSKSSFRFHSSLKGRDPEHAVVIKCWVEKVFGLGEDDSVMVTELHCTEPDCPPLETVIALLIAGRPALQHKIHKPISDVTEDDIRALAS